MESPILAPVPAHSLVSATPRLRLTPDEFLDWEARQDEKHEHYCGEVFAMPHGNVSHAQIIGNCLAALRTATHSRGCKVYGGSLRVRVEAADLFTYPDLSVVCGEARFADARRTSLLNPLVLVEVLSPSTEAYDRTTKFSFYAQLPSLAAYVLVGQDSPAVDVYSRDAGGWRVVRTTGGTAVIPTLGAALNLAEVYDGVVFPGPDEQVRPTPGRPGSA